MNVTNTSPAQHRRTWPLRPLFCSMWRRRIGWGLLVVFAANVCQCRESTLAAAPADTAAPPTAKKKDWALFRGDAFSTGIATASFPEKPELLWKFEVQGGAFENTAAIVDGVVYMGDLDGRLFALDLKTGDKKWERKLETGFIASPSIRDGRMYLGDTDGVFHCLDIRNGEPIWKFVTQAEIDSGANFYKDKVLVGSQDATLYCLTIADGKLAWKFSIADQIRCSPTIVENRCFVAGCDSKLHIVDLDKGDVLTTVEIDSPTGVTPAVRGDLAYFGTEGGTFFAVDWRNAKVEWKFEAANTNLPFRGSPAVTANQVIFGGHNKRIHSLDPKTGNELWEFTAKNRVESSTVIVGDRAFLGCADGRLLALDVKSGEVKWEYQASGKLTGSAAVADDRLVIASDRGVVYCFGKK